MFHRKRSSYNNRYNGYNGKYCSTTMSPREYRDETSNSNLQDLHLVGPNDIMWLVSTNLKESAYSLQAPQLLTAIQICIDCKHSEIHCVYGFWLTRVYEELVGRLHDVSVEFALHNPHKEAIPMWHRVIEKHQAFLQYLGDLQELVIRCRENEYKLTGIVRGDLRNCKPLEVKKELYRLGVPGTNYVNVYRHRFRCGQPVEACYVELWRNQTDPQIELLNQELGIL